MGYNGHFFAVTLCCLTPSLQKNNGKFLLNGIRKSFPWARVTSTKHERIDDGDDGRSGK
jgi:hypothetical protein